MAEMLPLDRITTEGTQARVALSETVIQEYAEALQQGDEFPPIEVYFDDTTYWLSDGFHRVQAAKNAGRDTIAATIHQGGRREALLDALGANDTHGLRRTDADRRHAVHLMLADSEWQEWNNSEIARRCRVSEFLVRTVRQELEPAKEKTQEAPERTRKVTRGGKTFTMRTARIGTAPAAKAPAVPHVAPSPGPTPSAALSGARGPYRETSAPVSSIESKIDTPTALAPYVHDEETASVAVLPIQTEEISHPEPITPPPQPSLIDVWQQAGDEERKAFVAAYRDDLRLLLAAEDKPQPTKRVHASQRTSRLQPQQQKRKRAAASKRS